MDEGEHGGCALVAHMSVQIIKNIAAAIPGCIAAEGPKGARRGTTFPLVDNHVPRDADCLS